MMVSLKIDHQNSWLRLDRPWLAAFLLVIGLASELSAGANTCSQPLPGLSGWWAGDGNANDLAGTNNGVLQNGATASVPGLVGLAFSFDGTNNYVEIPDSPSLRPTNLTIEAWVYFAALDSFGSGASPPGQQYIVFKQNSLSTNFAGFCLSKARTNDGDVLAFTVASASGEMAEIRSATLVTTGVWYHVACVRGSDFIQLYVDRQLEGQTGVTFQQDYGDFPLYFGTSGQSA